jgi:two-component system response regulator HydG
VIDAMEPKTGGRAPFAPVVLVVDDDSANLLLLQKALQRESYDVIVQEAGAQALEILRTRDVDLLISDLDMPGLSGIELLEHVRRAGWDVDVMILTAHASLENAVQCMRLSTLDFLSKPFDPAELRHRVRTLVQKRLIRRENRAAQDRRDAGATTLIGSSPALRDLRELLRRVAGSDEAVLIRGESGTGKELVARAIHAWSPRAAEPFLPVDCTTLSTAVVESEIFGHVKGAFTGAESARTGLFQAAGRGTIFLDEIGDFPIELQPKLLRALQEHEVRRVGSNTIERFQARVLAATHRDLEDLVRKGKFREDLYWRLDVLSVRVPPLRERREDVPELARYFIRKYDSSTEGPRELDATAVEALKGFDWPGNVRELENSIRRMLVLHPDALAIGDLRPPRTAEPAPAGNAPLENWERTAIQSALAHARGNVTQAARSLGIGKSTLYRKLKEYGLEQPPVPE